MCPNHTQLVGNGKSNGTDFHQAYDFHNNNQKEKKEYSVLFMSQSIK